MENGVCFHSIELVDMIWVWATCCALQNMLFEVDGLDEPWDSEELGNLESSDIALSMRDIFLPAEIQVYYTPSTEP